ncbi:MAG: homocysteine S-methyltransferase family protein [Gaiellales bacterium]
MRLHDGAYGTLLAGHLRGDETADDLCLREGSLVIDAHRAYIDAGARAIQTNAFLAHLRNTRRRRDALQLAALECAREAAAGWSGAESGTGAGAGEGESAIAVFATIGPAGDEPQAYWRDLETVLGVETTGVICETLASRAQADAWLSAWHDVASGLTSVEVLVGCTINPSAGLDACRWVLELATELPAHLQLGLNCCEGPQGLRPYLEQLSEIRGSVWTMPSAGIPVNGLTEAASWPLAEGAAWAEQVAELVEDLPVTAVGGCCGTHPESIERFAVI